MADPEPIEQRIKQIVRSTSSVDEMVTAFRALGLSKMESMIALEDHAAMPHPEAKLAVHRSTAWSETREAAEKLEEQTLAELEKRGRRKADGSIEL